MLSAHGRRRSKSSPPYFFSSGKTASSNSWNAARGSRTQGRRCRWGASSRRSADRNRAPTRSRSRNPRNPSLPRVPARIPRAATGRRNEEDTRDACIHDPTELGLELRERPGPVGAQKAAHGRAVEKEEDHGKRFGNRGNRRKRPIDECGHGALRGRRDFLGEECGEERTVLGIPELVRHERRARRR
jgi:hypothetical protein